MVTDRVSSQVPFRFVLTINMRAASSTDKGPFHLVVVLSYKASLLPKRETTEHELVHCGFSLKHNLLRFLCVVKNGSKRLSGINEVGCICSLPKEH